MQPYSKLFTYFWQHIISSYRMEIIVPQAERSPDFKIVKSIRDTSDKTELVYLNTWTADHTSVIKQQA